MEDRCHIMFPFLIGKVLTNKKDKNARRNCRGMFPFLIGKVLTKETHCKNFR